MKSEERKTKNELEVDEGFFFFFFRLIKKRHTLSLSLSPCCSSWMDVFFMIQLFFFQIARLI
jgi:hypothetical protein